MDIEIYMNNNDRKLVTTHHGNIVANDLRETNPKTISLAKTISWSLSAIALKADNSIYSFRKNIVLNTFVKSFLPPFKFVSFFLDIEAMIKQHGLM